MFEIINTPFPPVKTVRLDNGTDFRPCSTGLDTDELKTRTLMEHMEISHTNDHEIIASAAHVDRELSIKHARQEAVERISLAAWWALRKSFIGTVSDEKINTILHRNQIEIPESFSINVGFVESVHPGYHVACSILANNNEYPYVVLGGGCSPESLPAVEKALYESMQSWVATQWVDDHSDTDRKLYWDINELYRRTSDLLVGDNVLPDDKLPCPTPVILNKLRLRTTIQAGVCITEVVEPHVEPGTTIELAKLAMKDGERISVFTPHNM